MEERDDSWRPTVVVVGGFLGAGKTTLILEAARWLEKRGMRCAVVLNDQGQQLVDTEMARRKGVAAGEVTGGCFCCRFSELVGVMDQLRDLRPEVIFAEPVGSCTDIAATVLAPLRMEFASYRVAPFCVLVDPSRAKALRHADADREMIFLFEKQLEEADLVCMTKLDLHPDAMGLGAGDENVWFRAKGKPLLYLSAKSGQGMNEWLDQILNLREAVTRPPMEIDYERYARAEAALAWMNVSLRFAPEQATLPGVVAGEFLDGLDAALTRERVVIVHLKLMVTSATGWVKAAQCGNGQEPVVEGVLDASPAPVHEVLLNLRAVGEPETVEGIVRREIARLRGHVDELRLNCFSPAPPQPERRVVG